MENSAKDVPSATNFFRAFGGRVFVMMCGPASVPFTAAAIYVDGTWQKAGYAVVALLCASYSSYWVWSQERTTLNFLKEEVAMLRGGNLSKYLVLCDVQRELSRYVSSPQLGEAHRRAVWAMIEARLFPLLHPNERHDLSALSIADSNSPAVAIWLQNKIDAWANEHKPPVPPTTEIARPRDG